MSRRWLDNLNWLALLIWSLPVAFWLGVLAVLS